MPDAVDQIHEAQHRSRHERHAHEAMGDAAMVLQSRNGAFDLPEHVEIGGLGGEHHGYGGQLRLAIEARASKTCAGQKVGNGIQGDLECVRTPIVRRREVE